MRIYLDTCIVIYWLEGEPALADAISARVAEAGDSELRVSNGLKTPDAIHGAAAIHHGCSELWTNDHRLVALEARLAVRRIV